jgi:hypothetical protein
MRITCEAGEIGEQGRSPRPAWQVFAPAHNLATINWDNYTAFQPICEAFFFKLTTG